MVWIFYDWFVNFLFHQHELCSSATTNFFLGLIFLLMIWLISSKVRSSRFVGYALVENFIIASHPTVAKKKSMISFSLPFSLLKPKRSTLTFIMYSSILIILFFLLSLYCQISFPYLLPYIYIYIYIYIAICYIYLFQYLMDWLIDWF